MKKQKFLVLLGIVLLSISVGVWFINKNKVTKPGTVLSAIDSRFSTPENLFKTYIDSVRNKDTKSYLECFTEESRKEFFSKVKETDRIPDEVITAVKELSLDNYHVIEQTETDAILQREIDPNDVSTILLKKDGNLWKIDLSKKTKQILETYRGQKE